MIQREAKWFSSTGRAMDWYNDRPRLREGARGSGLLTATLTPY